MFCLRYCRWAGEGCQGAHAHRVEGERRRRASSRKNKKDKNDTLLAHAAASFGLSDRPANAEDEAAVLSR
eukprot:3403748-Prymnesium_polylepis.1